MPRAAKPIPPPIAAAAPKPRRKRQTQPQTLADGKVIQVAQAKPAKPVPERDARPRNSMSPEDRLIDTYLERWGRETREGTETGWAATTVLGRLMEQGAGAGQAGRPLSHLSEISARVDVCVARLWKQQQRCIRRYYQRHEPTEALAKSEGMSVRKMQYLLKRARELIGYWFFETEEALQKELATIRRALAAPKEPTFRPVPMRA